MEALLDDGSELNIMAKRAFEQLQHPIDICVNWRINGYDEKAEGEIAELGRGGNLVGVCHDVLVDVGGVVVKQHIFVVKYLNSDLILGRPWGRMTRAQMTNKDDGSYVVKIKSTDGGRIVKFIAVPAQHERIREYVRPADENDDMEISTSLGWFDVPRPQDRPPDSLEIRDGDGLGVNLFDFSNDTFVLGEIEVDLDFLEGNASLGQVKSKREWETFISTMYK